MEPQPIRLAFEEAYAGRDSIQQLVPAGHIAGANINPRGQAPRGLKGRDGWKSPEPW